ncbi:MAG: TauD/TfdA family dioxygenase [Actinobacteria bacterium]|nr:TauD/TfdA family dioxygenase [Actinomycetota bacterium]
MSTDVINTVRIDDLELPALWLRDACPCAACRHAGSGQRLHSVLALDPGTTVAAVHIDGDVVDVTFVPDHTARFSLAWLRAHAPGCAPVFDDRSERARRPWVAADLPNGVPTVAWSDLRGDGRDPGGRLGALRDLTDLGVLLVRDVPVVPGSVLDVARTIGFVRTTNYGDLFDVRVEPQPINLAYTGRAIAPHTDNPYREPIPGVQLLHCLSSSANGGENVLLDGFSVAAVLRREDPAAFATLTTTRLTFRYDDDRTALRASGPAIELNADGDVRGIRWNDRSIEPPQVPVHEVGEVYRALRAFAAVLARPELHLHLTLAPGDCIVFDNTRILHARTAFADGAGARHLQGCYADLDGLASARAVLERTGR